MNTFQSTFSSPRNQRILFWVALFALAAGVIVLVVKLIGGSSGSPQAPAKGFKPQLPAKQTPLTTANGIKVHEYKQLDPSVRQAIKRFVLGAVAEHNYADSWKVIAPSMKQGYTARTWVTSTSHPIIPFPVYHYERSQFLVQLATTKEIMVSIKLRPTPTSGQHETLFSVGLIRSRSHAGTWLVNYWGPLWTPTLPYGGP